FAILSLQLKRREFTSRAVLSPDYTDEVFGTHRSDRLPAAAPSPIASSLRWLARVVSPAALPLLAIVVPRARWRRVPPIFMRGGARSGALSIVVGASASSRPLVVVLVLAAGHQSIPGVDDLALCVHAEALGDAAHPAAFRPFA